MQQQAKAAKPKMGGNRKQRDLIVIGPDDPNYDTLMLRIAKRKEARAKRQKAHEASAR